MDIDIISSLYHYGLTIIKYEQDYCLVDLKTQEVYEKMSIYYIRRLLRSWNKHRKNTAPLPGAVRGSCIHTTPACLFTGR